LVYVETEPLSSRVSLADLDIENEDSEQIQAALDSLSGPESIATSYMVDEQQDPLIHHLNELRNHLSQLWQIREEVSFGGFDSLFMGCRLIVPSIR
jgi:hypothetical protein